MLLTKDEILVWLSVQQVGLSNLVKKANFSSPASRALAQRLVAYPATGMIDLYEIFSFQCFFL